MHLPAAEQLGRRLCACVSICEVFLVIVVSARFKRDYPEFKAVFLAFYLLQTRSFDLLCFPLIFWFVNSVSISFHLLSNIPSLHLTGNIAGNALVQHSYCRTTPKGRMGNHKRSDEHLWRNRALFYLSFLCSWCSFFSTKHQLGGVWQHRDSPSFITCPTTVILWNNGRAAFRSHIRHTALRKRWNEFSPDPVLRLGHEENPELFKGSFKNSF